jgi:hypothetical protein
VATDYSMYYNCVWPLASRPEMEEENCRVRRILCCSKEYMSRVSDRELNECVSISKK